jgi:cell division protein FtsI (penicillin-binding protein 3)
MAKANSKQRNAKRGHSVPLRLPSYTARRRVLIGVMASSALVLVWHAVDQQIFQGDFLRQEGRARYLRVVDMPALRGTITDRHGDPLAISTPVDSVWASPRQLSRDKRTLASLARVLDMNADHLRRLLAQHKDRGFVYLKRRVNPNQAEQIRALDLEGIGLQREYRRFYPTGEVGTHVVGFTDIDDRGQEGIELAYQDWLRRAFVRPAREGTWC